MYHYDKINATTKNLGVTMSMQVRDNHSMVEFTEDKIALLKNTVAKGVTDNELELFVHTCKRMGLDPFMRQIYCVKRGPTMTIQTGIDGYRLIADRSGKYMPGRESTYTYDKEGRLLSATAYVKKLGPDGQWHEVASTAVWQEYEANTPIWKKMPHVMLAKTAESAALRRAFPAEMSGVYTEEEMAQADIVDKRTGEIKSIDVSHDCIETVSISQSLQIAELVGDDIEYRDRIFKGYSKHGLVVKDYSDLPRKQFDAIVSKVKERNEQKLNDEMSNRVEDVK